MRSETGFPLFSVSPICSEKQNRPLRKAVQDRTDLIVSENDLETEVICACFALHLAVTRSSLYAARRQPLHKKLLTQDENQHHRDQRQHGHGEDVAPLSKLMLTKESGNGNG